MSPASTNFHIHRPASLLSPSPPSHVYTTFISVLLYIRLFSPYCLTSLPDIFSSNISVADRFFYPYYPASPLPSYSSSRISNAVFITSSSIVPHPFLPLWSYIYVVSMASSFLSLTYLYHRCPHRTHHLLFHCHFPLRLHCHHFCLAFIFPCILPNPPLIFCCNCIAPLRLSSP